MLKLSRQNRHIEVLRVRLSLENQFACYGTSRSLRAV